jgi:hypothetical protein
VKNFSFYKYAVASHLTLGGTLRPARWNGVVAQSGEQVDLPVPTKTPDL